ncbi:class I SAM-dependent methyltransferase [Anaplasma bovis]|uniref:class I SAM-dependent methyltransferase n=1 Tax=Anaplasma bovis TaxID=186733 RepID=UPI002FF04D24
MNKRIEKLIFSKGKCVPLDEFMKIALYHEDCGYYMKKMPFGKEGDFITSADISQLFGDVIALWLLQYLESIGVAEGFILMELGAGRGTLISDILRVIKGFPQYDMLLEVHIVEISPLLRSMQKHSIGKDTMRQKKFFWHTELPTSLPDCPIVVIANEFFDALPIKQFTSVEGEIRENCVICDGDLLTMGDMKATLPEGAYDNLEDGYIVENCAAAADIVKLLEKLLVKKGGAGLIIDYGYVQPIYKSTIQGVMNHGYCDFLKHAGECDISAYVDFGTLQRSLDTVVSKISTQRDFLHNFGIRERLEQLMQNATVAQAHELQSSYLRLTENMGTLFKAMIMHAV